MTPAQIIGFFCGMAFVNTAVMCAFITYALRDKQAELAAAWDLGFAAGLTDAEEGLEEIELAGE